MASPDDLLVLGCIFNEMAAVPCDAYTTIANALGRETGQTT